MSLMSATTYAVVADLCERLAGQGLAPELRLFGARARGDEDADLDLCLIFATVDAALIEQVHAKCWGVGFDHGVTICPLVVTRAELTHPSALMQQIRASGILYPKAQPD